MRVWVLATAALLIAISGRASAAPPEDEPQADSFISQLGDERYAVRERASEQLIQLGFAAVPALEKARRQADREIRYRAERILAIVQRNDFQRRLEAFAADPQGDDDYGLPGWSRFRENVGTTASDRALFVDMLRCEPELFQALGHSPREAGALLETRAMQIRLEIYQDDPFSGDSAPVGHTAALFFLVIQPDLHASDEVLRIALESSFHAKFERAATESAYDQPLRKLLSRAIEQANDFSGGLAIRTAMRYDLKEGIVPAVRILQGGQTFVIPPDRPVAVLALARFGDQSHTTLLENLLSDSTSVQTNLADNQSYDTQMRDLALAALWKLHGENPKHHGFSHFFREDPQNGFLLHTVGFPNEEKRSAALAEWTKFRAAQIESPAPENVAPLQ
jgi:hypothetical protein